MNFSLMTFHFFIFYNEFAIIRRRGHWWISTFSFSLLMELAFRPFSSRCEFSYSFLIYSSGINLYIYIDRFTSQLFGCILFDPMHEYMITLLRYFIYLLVSLLFKFSHLLSPLRESEEYRLFLLLIERYFNLGFTLIHNLSNLFTFPREIYFNELMHI